MTNNTENGVKSKEIVHFWIKTEDRDLDAAKVRSLKIKMASFKTIRRAKKSYSDKLGLEENKLEKLQFMFEGRMLEDEEQVGKFNQKVIYAEGLWFPC